MFVCSSFMKAHRLGIKSIQICWFFYFLIFFLSGHWKTSNLVEQAIEITIQCKFEITQQYWLPLYFTLNNKTDYMFSRVAVRVEFLTNWFSLSKFACIEFFRLKTTLNEIILLRVYMLRNFWNDKSTLPDSAHRMQEYDI